MISTTRAFCAARAGQIFSKEEIDAWEELDWAGKDGSVWVDRGGFGCRHHFAPVKREWIDNGKVEVQDFFKESGGRPEKLEQEVLAERRRIEELRKKLGIEL